MRLGDVPQVTEIDREAFPTQWPPVPYKRELNSRLVRYLIAYDEEPAAVEGGECQPGGRAECAAPAPVSWFQRLRSRLKHVFSSNASTLPTSQHIVGVAGFWILFDEAHLSTIAVRQSHRRQGIGELLLISYIELAAKLGAQIMSLEVRVSGLGPQALYEKYGFRKIRTRRGYYTDDGEDALVMQTEKITSPACQAEFQRLKQAHAEKWAVTSGQVAR
jgi:ribosomal-protein-alanine N-acetyltransferase